MKTFWNIYTKIIIGVVIATLFAAGGVNYYTKKESDARYPKISDGIPLRDSVYVKSQTDALLALKARKTYADSLLMQTWRKVDCGNVGTITHTGTGTETLLKSVTIDPARLGLNGEIAIQAIFDANTGDGFGKTYTIKINGTVVFTQGVVNSTYFPATIKVVNKNSNTDKIVFLEKTGAIPIVPNTGIESNTFAVSVDTSSSITVGFYIQLANTSSTSQLEYVGIQTLY